MQKKPLLWDNKYGVGVDTIDSEHKVFLAHINAFKWAIDHNSPTKELDQIAENLSRYAKFHFTSEESFMAKIKYPGLDEQRKIHNSLLDSFQSSYYLSKYQSDFLNFLVNWFIEHTTITDHKIGEYMQHKNINPKDYTYSIFK